MIFRNDDCGLETERDYPGRLEKFIAVHELFKKYDVEHHVAIIAEDIDQATELVKYINANPLIKTDVHCWRHIHYIKKDSNYVAIHLALAVHKIKEVFGQTPKYFFPPWNEMSREMEVEALRLKLLPSYNKISLEEYLAGKRFPAIINFHFWHDDLKIIEEALIKFTATNEH